MSRPVIDPGDIRTSEYIITHVFWPPKFSGVDDHGIQNDFSLATVVVTAARLYREHVSEVDIPQWRSISRMMENLQATMQSESLDRFRTMSQFSSMDVGGQFASLQTDLEAYIRQMSSHCSSEPKMWGSFSGSRRTSLSSSRLSCLRWLRM